MDTTEECYLLWNHVVRAKQHKGTFVSVYLCCGRSPTVSHTQQNNACVHRGWLCVLCVVVISFMAAVWNHNCSSLRCHILTWLSRWDGEDTVHRVQFLLKKNTKTAGILHSSCPGWSYLQPEACRLPSCSPAVTPHHQCTCQAVTSGHTHLCAHISPSLW